MATTGSGEVLRLRGLFKRVKSPDGEDLEDNVEYGNKSMVCIPVSATVEVVKGVSNSVEVQYNLYPSTTFWLVKTTHGQTFVFQHLDVHESMADALLAR